MPRLALELGDARAVNDGLRDAGVLELVHDGRSHELRQIPAGTCSRHEADRQRAVAFVDDLVPLHVEQCGERSSQPERVNAHLAAGTVAERQDVVAAPVDAFDAEERASAGIAAFREDDGV